MSGAFEIQKRNDVRDWDHMLDGPSGEHADRLLSKHEDDDMTYSPRRVRIQFLAANESKALLP